MQNRFVFPKMFLLLLVVFIAACDSTTTSEPTTTVRPTRVAGIVRNATSYEVLKDVTVTLMTEEPCTTVTDAKGEYRFDEPPLGYFPIYFEKAGYKKDSFAISVVEGYTSGVQMDLERE